MRKFKLFLSLLMLMAFSLGNVWAKDVTVSWTASSGALGSTISAVNGTANGNIITQDEGKTVSYQWSYSRTLKSGADNVGFTSNCIQLGKNGGVENITFSTSKIPGTIKSVSVECSSYNNAHKVSITVGGKTYLASTATAKWTTVNAKSGTGTSSGEIIISFTDGSRALYIKSISVTYEETSSATLTSIAISGTPDKTDYEVGETFDPTGLVATGSYDDDSEEDLTSIVDWAYTPAGALTLGLTSVNVTATKGTIVGNKDVNITVSPHTIVPGTYTVDLNSTEYGVDAQTTISEAVTLTQHDVTVETWCTSGTKPRIDADYVRYYNGSYAAISVPSGYNITKIVLLEPSSGASWGGSVSADKGNYDSETKTWTGEAQTVKISFGATNRMAGIEVTYSAPQPGVSVDPEEGLAFGNVKLNAEVAAKEIVVEGENLTSDLTATSSNTDVFTVAVKEGDSLEPDAGAVIASLVVTPITAAYGDFSENITISGGGLTEGIVVPVTMHVGGIVTVTNVPSFDFGEIYQGADPTDYKKSFHLHVENLTANKELRVNCAVGFTADPYSPTADENGVVDTDVYVYPTSTDEKGTLSEKIIDVRCTGNREFSDYEVGEMSVTIIDAPSCSLLEKPTLDNENTWASYDNAQLAWTAVANASQYLVNVTEHEGDPKITNLKTSSLTTSILNTKVNTRYDYTIMAVGDGTDYCEEGNPVLEGYFTTADYPAATLTLSENGVERALPGSHKLNDVVALPTEVETTIPEKTFVGWSTVEIAKTDVKPAYLEPGAEFTFNATSNKLYAVYASGHGALDEWQVTTEVKAGDVVVFSTIPSYTTNDMKTNGSFGTYTYMNATASTYNADKSKITSLASGALQYTVGGNADDGWTLTNEGQYLYIKAAKQIGLQNEEFKWSISFNNETKVATVTGTLSETDYTMFYNYNKGSDRFNVYASKGSMDEVSLYKHVVGDATWNGYTTSGPKKLANPTFSVEAGTYTETKSIELNAADGTIYYTLDGTDPTTESTPYTAAIALDSYGSYTIKAIAIDGDNKSEVVSATYGINIPFETVSDLFAYIATKKAFLGDISVTGVVSEIVTEYSTEHSNITFNISDTGAESEAQFQSYRGVGEGIAEVVAVGDKVTITGEYTLYGTTHELKQGNVISNRVAAVVKSVVISGTATNTEYYYNDDFSFKGLTAKAIYNTGYEKDVTSEEGLVWAADPDKVTATGDVNVTATYGGKTSDAKVVAVTKQLRELTDEQLAWSADAATAYTVGKTYTLPTLTKATISNEEDHEGEISIVAAGSTVIKAAFAGNDEYAAKEVSYTLTVYAPATVVVTGEATKTEYFYSETFSLAGLGAKATYADETEYEIPAEEITWAPAEAPAITANTNIEVTATWQGITSDVKNVAVTKQLRTITDEQLAWSAAEAKAYTVGKTYTLPTLTNELGLGYYLQ